MRTCIVCKQTKDIKAFGFRDKATGRRQRACKACVAADRRSRASADRHEEGTRGADEARQRTRTLRAQVWRYLAQHPCVDCGETDPLVLAFERLDADSRRDAISRLVHQAASWAAILDEIRRCDIRCANCHRRRVAAQFGWARLQFGQRG
jgi:hypothetical protein